MVRRVVTGTDSEGRSVFLHDAEAIELAYEHTAGFRDCVVWTTIASPTPEMNGAHARPNQFVPGPGETLALTLTFPPDSVFTSDAFDVTAAVEENLRNSPGLFELFEPDAPGMHTTPTVDYAVVLDGTVVLELDDGATTSLGVGDIVVQNGARHAWRVPSEQPATIFVILTGVSR
jgi:hypothetical protein